MPKSQGRPETVGVDGAKQNWIAVWLTPARFEYAVYESPAALFASNEGARIIAVDIPIGLSDRGGRDADGLARKFVGPKRASSIFSVPVRGVLQAESQAAASILHREIDGRGLSAQAFGILPKIRDWDDLLRSSERARTIVYESHPEVSFAALNGGVGLVAPKKSAAGSIQRCALLTEAFGESLVLDLVSRVSRREAALDDVYDAVVALWTAQRIATGTARSLPDEPRADSAGLRTAIWY